MPERVDITELAYRVTGRFPKFAPQQRDVQMFLLTEAPELIANLDPKAVFETAHVVSEAWEFLKKLFDVEDGKGRDRRCRYIHKSIGRPCGAVIHVCKEAGYIVATCEAGHEQRRKTTPVPHGLLGP